MKSQLLYINHIHEALQDILAFTREGRDFFMTDKKTQNAVIRSFEVIGEAAKRLDPNLTGQYPETPWKTIAGFRDVLIHAYHRVDLEEVWNIIEQHVPSLAETVAKIRASLVFRP